MCLENEIESICLSMPEQETSNTNQKQEIKIFRGQHYKDKLPKTLDYRDER